MVAFDASKLRSRALYVDAACQYNKVMMQVFVIDEYKQAHIDLGGDGILHTVVCSKLPYGPKFLDGQRVLTIDEAGNLLEGVENAKFRRSPFVVAFRVGDAYAYSVRGTQTLGEVKVDLSIRKYLRVTRPPPLAAERLSHKVPKGVHYGILMFGTTVASMVVADLRKQIGGDIGSAKVRMYGHSLGASAAMVAGHLLAGAASASDVESTPKGFDAFVPASGDGGDGEEDIAVSGGIVSEPEAAVVQQASQRETPSAPPGKLFADVRVMCMSCPLYAPPGTSVSIPSERLPSNLRLRHYGSPKDMVLYSSPVRAVAPLATYPFDQPFTVRTGTCMHEVASTHGSYVHGSVLYVGRDQVWACQPPSLEAPAPLPREPPTGVTILPRGEPVLRTPRADALLVREWVRGGMALLVGAAGCLTIVVSILA
jgi:hypothetical protein